MKQLTKEKLIRQCRYYKGEEKSPFNDNMMDWFWDMERVYVNHDGIFEDTENMYSLIRANNYKGIPRPLLLTMFTSWGKQIFDIKKFIGDFYKIVDEYLEIPSAIYPKDKIPN